MIGTVTNDGPDVAIGGALCSDLNARLPGDADPFGDNGAFHSLIGFFGLIFYSRSKPSEASIYFTSGSRSA